MPKRSIDPSSLEDLKIRKYKKVFEQSDDGHDILMDLCRQFQYMAVIHPIINGHRNSALDPQVLGFKAGTDAVISYICEKTNKNPLTLKKEMVSHHERTSHAGSAAAGNSNFGIPGFDRS